VPLVSKSASAFCALLVQAIPIIACDEQVIYPKHREGFFQSNQISQISDSLAELSKKVKIFCQSKVILKYNNYLLIKYKSLGFVIRGSLNVCNMDSET
jgi:hypothetical protein